LIYDDDSDLVIDQDVEFHGSRLGKKKQPVTTSLVGVEEMQKKIEQKEASASFPDTRTDVVVFVVVGCRMQGVRRRV